MVRQTDINPLIHRVPGLDRQFMDHETGAPSSPGRLTIWEKLRRATRFDRRRSSLRHHLRFVAQAYDDFEFLISEFLRQNSNPLPHSSVVDSDRMLRWMLKHNKATPAQRDYIQCQRGRQIIDERLHENYPAYLQFKQLVGQALGNESYSVEDRGSPGFGQVTQDPINQQRIYLNPVRAWTTLHTHELLESDCELPANVLQYAVDNRIAHAVFGLEGQALINELAELAPCTFEEWRSESFLEDHDRLVQFGRQLGQLGIAALRTE